MRPKNFILLMICALIWGSAFVAQSVGMNYVGPFFFLWSRSIIGAIVLLPVVVFLRHYAKKMGSPVPQDNRALLLGGLFCGTALFLASGLQQIGLLYTTVGKSGFLTACYILIVPFLGLLLGKRVRALIWVAVGIALCGLYFLCMKGSFTLGLGDALTLLCAAVFACHIQIISHFAPRVDCVAMSCLQFFVVALWSTLGMALFEMPAAPFAVFGFLPPTLEGFALAKGSILYAGLLSSGVAYTLQIIGQKGANPTICSLLMSSESVISVLSGWILLGQALTGREIFGCVLMFVAILLAQLPEKKPSAV